MHLQVLSSGSRGNSTLVRAGDTTVLVDAGLTAREMTARLDAARVSPLDVDHIAVTHGHLDHARSAGILAKRSRRGVLHCAERLMGNRSIHRAPRLAKLRVGVEVELDGPRAGRATGAPGALGAPSAPGAPGAADALALYAAKIPHDADPTVALRLRHGDRRAVVLTDMGRPDAAVAQRLAGAHVLVLEFNHDAALLEAGPYPRPLKRRIAGDAGHLSNEQAAEMLRRLATDALHTLVLAHLSEQNNRPELALAAAHGALDDLGLRGVEVLVASQHEVGPNLAV